MSKLKCQICSLNLKTFEFYVVVLSFAFYVLSLAAFPKIALAVVDPLASPNNKHGIHIISATPDEASPAASLVNSSGGDWGYVTVLIQRNDRKLDKWQTFFDDLRRRHLIPIVRIATEPEGNFWRIPTEGDAESWTDFLDSLNWPTKNRYIIIYNEPNHGQEWGGAVDAASYAKVLDQTITALKNKNQDFFVLNAGLDASTPQKPPAYQDELNYMRQMETTVPGIFNKLDGWVSHSYPNPGFAGSPHALGRGTVRTWVWELQNLRSFGVTKVLPVFITETGWKHSSGKTFDKSLPSPETVAEYLQVAFDGAWNSERVVAVTPFLLNYQDYPFDHFSFKKLTGEIQNQKVLGIQSPEYYPHYYAMQDLIKISGKPVQEDKAELIAGEVFPSIVSGENYTIPLIFKNTGQSIWNDEERVTLRATTGDKNLGAITLPLDTEKKIEPGQEAKFNLHLKAPNKGTYKLTLQLFRGEKSFDQKPLDYNIEVKSPVILSILGNLKFKDNPAGDYRLLIDSDILRLALPIKLDPQGKSEEMEARYLLPDHKFTFTLQKTYYKEKTLDFKLSSGVNKLDFGELEPDYISALLKPKELWNLLPFSN